MAFAGDQPNRNSIDLTPVGAAPSNAIEGSLIYHTTSGLVFYTGSDWVQTSGIVTSVNSETGVVSLEINDISDINTAGAAETDVLALSGTTWVPSGVSGGSSTLDALTDTTLSSLTAGDAIRWTGATWENQQDASDPVPAVADLDDTTITSVASGEVLTFNGAGTWVNQASAGGGSLSGLSDTTITAPPSGSILSYNGSEWIDVGAPTDVQTSGYVRTLIASGTVTAGTSFDTPSISGTNYSNVRVEMSNIDVSTELYLYMVAVNSDSTEQTGASDYGSHINGGSATFVYGLGDSTSNRIRIGYDGAGAMHSTGDDDKTYTVFEYMNPQEHLTAPTTTPALFSFEMSNIRTDAAMGAFGGAGFFDPSATGNALDKIRIKSSTGNFTCTYKVYADVPVSVLVTEAAAVTALSDLSDTTTTAPASGEVLMYDGSTWANAAATTVTTSGYQWKLLETQAALTTSVSFTGLEDHSAAELRIVGQSLALDNTDADYKIEMLLGGTDDVVNTGASDYMRTNWNLFNTTNSNAGDFADDSIVINTTTAEAGGALETMDFDCKITGIDSANYAFVSIEGLSVHNNAAAPNAFNVKARHNVLEELGVVKILHQDVTDVWTGGSFELWGLVPIEVLVTGASALTALNDLSDATVTTPASGQHLEYDGADWVNATPAGSSGPASGHVWRVLQQGTADGTSAININDVEDDLVDCIELSLNLWNIALAADGCIDLRFGNTSNSIQTGANDYGHSSEVSGYGSQYDSLDDSIRLWRDTNTLMEASMNGQGHINFRIANPNNLTDPLCVYADGGFLSHNTAQYRVFVCFGTMHRNRIADVTQFGSINLRAATATAMTVATNFIDTKWILKGLFPA